MKKEADVRNWNIAIIDNDGCIWEIFPSVDMAVEELKEKGWTIEGHIVKINKIVYEDIEVLKRK